MLVQLCDKPERYWALLSLLPRESADDINLINEFIPLINSTFESNAESYDIFTDISSMEVDQKVESDEDQTLKLYSKAEFEANSPFFQKTAPYFLNNGTMMRKIK